MLHRSPLPQYYLQVTRPVEAQVGPFVDGIVYPILVLEPKVKKTVVTVFEKLLDLTVTINDGIGVTDRTPSTYHS